MAEPSLKVFFVPELLEMVLRALPAQDILLSLRVCKFWKQVIDGSLELQRALYLKADLPTGLSDDRPLRITRNPLLERLLPQHKYTRRMAMNRQGKLLLPLSWHQTGASWRSMLLSRPALTAIELDIELDEGCMVFPSRVQNAAGVTMNDVLAKVVEVKAIFRAQYSVGLGIPSAEWYEAIS